MSQGAVRALRAGWFADAGAAQLQPLGEGHINDTWLVSRSLAASGQTPQRFVLQALSPGVFADQARVVGNLQRVLEHFAHTESKTPLPASVPELPQLVKTTTGNPAWIDAAARCWRLWRFREATRIVERPVSEAEAWHAGQAFGAFQRQMLSFPEPALEPAISGFLDLEHYLAEYDQILTLTRLEVPQAQRSFIDARRPLAGRLRPQGDYIHGDCKLDNLLFVADGHQVDCVLDLDTVMPGHWAWDFGDLARSLATTEGQLRDELFLAAARGFMAGSGRGGGGSDELAMLLEAPVYVTFMLAVRFFSDHLAGDRYFKVAAAGDNLRRAREQIALVVAFEQHLPRLGERLSADPAPAPG